MLIALSDKEHEELKQAVDVNKFGWGNNIAKDNPKFKKVQKYAKNEASLKNMKGE